jgi:circadian clock protein KaiC
MTGAALSAATAAPALIKAPTGIAGLDELTGGGLPAGRPTLVCGGAGCGKTLLAASFLANGALRFDEPGVFMGFEETAADLGVNAASIGFDLERLAAEKRIVVDYVHVQRSEIEETGEYDLEGLFIRLGYAIDSIGARRVVLDTIETLFGGLSDEAVLRAELRRLFGWLKDKGVSAIITGERGAGQLTRHGLEEYVSSHDEISLAPRDEPTKAAAVLRPTAWTSNRNHYRRIANPSQASTDDGVARCIPDRRCRTRHRRHRACTLPQGR